MHVGRYEDLVYLSIAIGVVVLVLAVLRLVGKRSRRIASVRLAGDGSFDCGVEQFDPSRLSLDDLLSRTSRSSQPCVAELVPESGEAPDAMRVRVVIDGASVGQIPRRDARHVLAAMDGRPAQCDGLIMMTPTAHGPSLVVMLDIAWPPRAA